jgi:hypothetical protein
MCTTVLLFYYAQEMIHQETNIFVLSKQDTNVMKGIAIIAMLCHHVYTRLPNWVEPYSTYLTTLGELGKVCVAIFLFCSGYGLAVQYDKVLTLADSFKDQINATKDYANTQSQLQQENTNLAIEQINQQKAQAEKDYTKEQAGAYVDWQKQSGQYGANAEAMAAQGLTNTGFSESSQVSMYNTYQNRVATARDSFNRAVLNYDNSIKEAQLANNSKLAEIAFNALQTQLELSLQGFQYKNQLLQTQIEQQQQTEDRYYARWQDVLGQMNQENQFAESIRQYEQNYAFEQKQFTEQIRQFNEEIARLKKKDAEEYAMEIQRLELQKQQVAQAKAEADREYQLKVQQMNQSQSNWEKEYALAKKSAGGGGGGGGSAAIEKDPVDNKAQVNTPYYQGALNPDAKNGTFSNGYQPNNIGGKKLSKTGDTITFDTRTLSGQKQTVTQTIWKTPNGKRYYWDGRENKYLEVPKSKDIANAYKIGSR